MLKTANLRRLAPRRVVLVTAVLAAAIMGDSMLYNVLPSRVDAFGVSVGLVGVLLSANRIVRLASNQVAAWLIERIGMRGPLLASVLLAVGATLIYGTAPWFSALLLARIVWGMAFSVFRLSGYLVVLEESVEGSRGRLMGFFSSGMRVGSIIGVLLGGLLFDLTGRTSSFLIIAAMGLLGVPAAIALLRSGSQRPADDQADSSAKPCQTKSQPAAKATSGFSSRSDYTTAYDESLSRFAPLSKRIWDVLISRAPELSFRERRMILSASFTYFSFQLVMNGVLISSLGYFLNQRLGAGAAVGGIMIGIATLNGMLISTRWISGLSAPYFGHIGDRFGRTRILAVSLPICLVALLLLAFSPSFWLIVAWLPLAFAATAASITALDSLVGGLAPEGRRAQIMSRYATWQDTGSALGPLIAFAVLGFTTLTFVYVGGAILLALAFAVFVGNVRTGRVAVQLT
ncbi:MAG: MFS transporter [Chloroflexi bacterium]|nr:MFS transporter [Chloroflexota bacterium]MCH9040351.1 MFS transporter [Chloroflexota bacterium]